MISLDYEQNTTFLLDIQASDSLNASLFNVASLTVHVVDVNDNKPVVERVSLQTVYENSRIGSVVVRINATDADTGKNGELEFNIVFGNVNSVFNITQSGFLVVTKHLNAEETSLYSLLINVSDGGLPALVTSIQMDVRVLDQDEFPPVFLRHLYSVAIRENTSVGDDILQLAAFDSDLTSNLTFSFLKGNSDRTFLLDPNTATVSLAKPLDRETVASYLLTAEVKDLSNVSASDTTLVNI